MSELLPITVHSYNLRPRISLKEFANKGTLWKAVSPSTIIYVPSENAKIKHCLKDVVKIDLTDHTDEWNKCLIDKDDHLINADENYKRLFKVTTSSFNLLFSVRSLCTIYHLFLEESEDANFQEEVEPDSLYQTYKFIVRNLNSARDKTEVEFRMNFIEFSRKRGLTYCDGAYKRDGSLLLSELIIAFRLINDEHFPEFQDQRLYLMILLLCHDLIDLIAANYYGQSEDGTVTPVLKKFHVMSKHAPNTRVEASFAWERHSFGALAFVDYQLEPPYSLKRIIFNVFEELNGSINEYFGTPKIMWLENLYLGCQAKTLISKDSVIPIHDEENIIKLFIEAFQRTLKDKHRTCCKWI